MKLCGILPLVAVIWLPHETSSFRLDKKVSVRPVYKRVSTTTDSIMEAVWADEVDEDDLPDRWREDTVQSFDTEQATEQENEKPLDTLERLSSDETLEEKKDTFDAKEESTAQVVVKEVSNEKRNIWRDESEPELKNSTRQLEIAAFPAGIAIGAIGTLLLPALFPARTTTTTTTTTAASAVLNPSQGQGTDGVTPAPQVTAGTDAPPAEITTTTAATSTFSPTRSILEDFPDCGEKGSSSRVIGGSEIVENEYPWLCSLKYKGFHICGITLISGPPYETILVGAAHCYSVGDNPNNYKVTCGEHSLKETDNYEVTMTVNQVIIHPKYIEASSTGFDIAVYKVDDSPLQGKMQKKKIWPVCLPELEEEYMKETTYVAGWGITKTKNIHGSRIQVKGIPDVARHAAVTVTSCVDNDNFDYPLGLICAAEPGADSCQGDSGGPLIGTSKKYTTSSKKRYAWLGIVSFGVGCAEIGYPGAYTRTSCFLGFVAEQFGLRADFTIAGEHSGWSTDCPAGASRISSAANRRQYRYRSRKVKQAHRARQGDIEEAEKAEDKDKDVSAKPVEQAELPNKSQKDSLKDNNAGQSSTSEKHFVTKDQLITIENYADEAAEVDVEPPSVVVSDVTKLEDVSHKKAEVSTRPDSDKKDKDNTKVKKHVKDKKKVKNTRRGQKNKNKNTNRKKNKKNKSKTEKKQNSGRKKKSPKNKESIKEENNERTRLVVGMA